MCTHDTIVSRTDHFEIQKEIRRKSIDLCKSVSQICFTRLLGLLPASWH